jgi:hypothetical protein
MARKDCTAPMKSATVSVDRLAPHRVPNTTLLSKIRAAECRYRNHHFQANARFPEAFWSRRQAVDKRMAFVTNGQVAGFLTPD